MTFAQMICTIRKNSNLSQSAFAERIGVSQQAVCMWELGERMPNGVALAGLLLEYPEYQADILSAVVGPQEEKAQ